MKRFLVLALFVLGVAWWWHEPAARWKGFPAARDPVQTMKKLPAAFAHGELTIKPLATYAITAVVLSASRYRFDAMAKLAPVDLALGWGPMSVAGVINDLKISQRGRFYFYQWSDEAPLAPEEIVKHSANTHCLPGDAAIRSELLAVRRHELVTLEGYLVEVTGPGGLVWRSSLTRDDSEGGACEILWITSIRRDKIKGGG